MSTTLVHIGDFHAAPGPRNADRYRALDQIIRQSLQLPRLGAWLWPGDLFDAASTAEDRNALDERLVQMANAAPVVLCDGNHDKPGDLDGFARLKANHPISVISRPHVQVLRLATGEMAAVFVLPYPHKAGLAAAGLAPGDVVHTAADLLEPIFMAAAAQLEDCRAAGMLTLMIGHVNVAGAIASTGQPNIGREIELNPTHLDRLGPIPKLLNHIHKPQEIHGAHYAGSVARMDYGEIEEKSYIVVEFDRLIDNDETFPWTWSLERKPIDVAPMFHVTGTLDRVCFSIDDASYANPAIRSRLVEADWSGADVRVRYTFKASDRQALALDTLPKLFAGALRLKLEGIAEPDRELRAPEVAAAKTLPEKLAAYRKVETLEPSVAAKLEWLENPNFDFLGAVTLALAAIEQPERVTVAA